MAEGTKKRILRIALELFAQNGYLAGGPLEYMAAIFRKLADSDEDAMQLALEFYGPMYLLYSVYDGAEEKESVSSLLATHIDRFIARVESDYRKKERTT